MEHGLYLEAPMHSRRWVHRDVPSLLTAAEAQRAALHTYSSSLGREVTHTLQHRELLMLTSVRKRLQGAKEENDRLAAAVQRQRRDVEAEALRADIDQFQRQIWTLERRQQRLETDADVHQKLANSRKIEVAGLYAQLRTVARENLGLSQERKSRSISVNNSPEKVGNVGAPLPATCPSSPIGKSIRSNIAFLRLEKKRFASVQADFFIKETQYEQFFQDCLVSCKREFVRLQKLPDKGSGLKGSLYFSLLSTAVTDRHQRLRSYDQPIEELLKHTAKSLISTGDRERRKGGLLVPLRSEELRKLLPIERLGLLMTDTSMVKRLHEKVFPTNILCLRPTSRLKRQGDERSHSHN